MKKIYCIIALALGALAFAQLPKPGGSSGGSSLTAGTDYSAPSLYDTYANIAAATCSTAQTGRLGFTGVLTARCSGTAWQWFYSGEAITLPPTAGWSWDNQGTSTEDQTGGFFTLSVQAAAGQNRIRYRTAPTVPYVITIKGSTISLEDGESSLSLVFRESSSGKLHTLGISGGNVSVGRWTTSTAWSSTDVSATTYNSGVVALRIADNNTNRLFSISRDGVTFQQIFSVARTTFLTADQIGWGAYLNSGSNMMATMYSWKAE